MGIFRDSIETLIEKSEKFSMRHNNDVVKLREIVREQYRSKIEYEKCATVWYVNKYWKHNFTKEGKKYIGIEIKDDREWRRYYKITKPLFYKELERVVDFCKEEQIEVVFFSHDGSSNFVKYLRSKNKDIHVLFNNSGNEEHIMENYSKIKVMICCAGHSQMISNGCGIKTLSLVTHPKVKSYCEDIGDNNFIEVNKVKESSEISQFVINKLQLEE